MAFLKKLFKHLLISVQRIWDYFIHSSIRFRSHLFSKRSKWSIPPTTTTIIMWDRLGIDWGDNDWSKTTHLGSMAECHIWLWISSVSCPLNPSNYSFALSNKIPCNSVSSSEVSYTKLNATAIFLYHAE